jgi:hypothetical protein
VNNRRVETFSSLLLLILVVIMVVGVGRWYMVTRQIEKIMAEDAQRVIGSDKALLDAVQDLETTLTERIAYQPSINKDPLDLTKVITSAAFLEKLGADQMDPDRAEMRLAATVVGDDGVAAIVIRYLGSNHVLRVGDEIEGWKVIEITRRNATLVNRGQKKVLENRPMRESLRNTGNVLSVLPIDDYDSTSDNF